MAPLLSLVPDQGLLVLGLGIRLRMLGATISRRTLR